MPGARLDKRSRFAGTRAARGPGRCPLGTGRGPSRSRAPTRQTESARTRVPSIHLGKSCTGGGARKRTDDLFTTTRADRPHRHGPPLAQPATSALRSSAAAWSTLAAAPEAERWIAPEAVMAARHTLPGRPGLTSFYCPLGWRWRLCLLDRASPGSQDWSAMAQVGGCRAVPGCGEAALRRWRRWQRRRDPRRRDPRRWRFRHAAARQGPAHRPLR